MYNNSGLDSQKVETNGFLSNIFDDGKNKLHEQSRRVVIGVS